jgi:DHA2 family multidrug resistance protein
VAHRAGGSPVRGLVPGRSGKPAIVTTTESIDDLFARYGPSYRVLVMVAGMTASFTMVMSSTIVNVATPDVMGAFGIGLDRAQLMASAFNITMVTCQLLSAWLVATLGQRGAFLLMAAIFSVGSITAALAHDFTMVVVGRVLQGSASGVIQPLVMVIAFQVFPASRRGFAMAVFSMGVFMAVAIGPMFGGLFIDLFHWRYIFWAPLPVIAAAAAMGWVFIPSVPSTDRRPFDWIGYILLVVSVYCLITGMTEGTREGWNSGYILSLFTIGIVSGTAMVITQLRPRAALMDVSLFRNKRFAMAALIGFVFGFGNFGAGYAVPVFTQLVQGLRPLDAALMMLPSALLIVTTLPFTGKLADTMPAHWGIMIGLLLFAVGNAPMSGADVNTPVFLVMCYFIISRMGMSFTQPFIMTTAMQSVPQDKLSAGGGMINFTRQLGGSLGLTAWVAFVQTRTELHSEALTATQRADNATTRQLVQEVERLLDSAGLPREEQASGALHYLGRVIEAQASTLGFQDGFMLLVVAFIAAMVPAWLLGRVKD